MKQLQTVRRTSLLSGRLKTCHLGVLWFNPKEQLSTMQPPIHSPSLSQCDGDRNKGKKVKLVG